MPSLPKRSQEGATRKQRSLLQQQPNKPPLEKTSISFADQQKKHIWKWKLVLSWRTIVQRREKNTPKATPEAALGKILKYFRESRGKGKADIDIPQCLSAPKGTTLIVSAEDLPNHNITWKDNYDEINPKAYYPIYKGKTKKIQD